MTDRELLERAAKAANYPLDDGAFGLLDWWNPLEDDGDALRLAVKINLLHLHYQKIRSQWDAMYLDGTLSDDDYAATRRAIVRAAAAMAEDV